MQYVISEAVKMKQKVSFGIDVECGKLHYTERLKNGTETKVDIDFNKVATERELILARSNEEPIFIFKKDGLSYYIRLEDKHLKLWPSYYENKMTHLCDQCCNCYAGRCPKVSDHFFEGIYREGITEYTQTIIDAKRIEKYPFITEGCELYGTDKDYFICSKCER